MSRVVHEPVDGLISARENGDAPGILAIETRALRKSFGSSEVLAGVDLHVPEGCICSVMGPSGTGKSVLIKHILGLCRPDSGDVLVRGPALSKMSRSEVIAMRRDIGVMFQDGALFSSMTVYENVAFPLRQHTDQARERLRRGPVARADRRVWAGGNDVGLRRSVRAPVPDRG